MSGKEIQRPRSIIKEPTPQVQAQLPTKPSGADRFLRTLLQLPHKTAAIFTPDRSEPSTRTEKSSSSKSAATAPSTGSQPAVTVTAAPSVVVQPLQAAVSPMESNDDAGADGGAASDTPTVNPMELFGSSGDAPQGWEQPLVDVIAKLCRTTDPSFETWTVVIPMDGRVLPETELHLTLSRGQLSLRFQTQLAYSQRLLLAHRPLLNDLLVAAVPNLQGLDIDIT